MQIDSLGRLIVTSDGAIYSNPYPGAIPDNGCATNSGMTSTIIVSGQPTPVQSSKISVQVNISHTFDADLKIFLISPGGDILTLAASNGSFGHNFTNTIFTDVASINISAGSAPFTGLFKPLGSLVSQCTLTPTVSTLGGIGSGTIIPNGNWALVVFDGSAVDIGTLNSWNISFTGPESYTTFAQNNYIPKYTSGSLVASAIYQDPVNGNIAIGTSTPAASALLDLTSTAKGFLPPRMDSIARNAIASPSPGLIIYNTNIKGFQCYNGTAWYSTVHYIGEYYGGGIVYYVYDNGQHGLIAATADQNAGIRWDGGSLTYTRSRANGIGAGLKNTAIIIANQAPVDGGPFAATACNEYNVTVGGVTYANWYLPSSYELNLLYNQRVVVGGFNGSYWTSNESGNTLAIFLDFTVGAIYGTTKDAIHSVRAIREF